MIPCLRRASLLSMVQIEFDMGELSCKRHTHNSVSSSALMAIVLPVL